MDLTPEQRDALAELRDGLDEEIARLQRRREAIVEWLSQAGPDPHNGGPVTEAPEPPGSSLSGKSLRDAIRAVVTETPFDLSPVQAAKSLEARGYRDNAKTDLKRRVGKEMWELARSGVLEKTGRGTYGLAKKAEVVSES